MSDMLFVPDVVAAFTANGNAQGLVTVASTAKFSVGSRCGLTDNSGTLYMNVQVVSIPSATTMTVRALGPYLDPKVQYGVTDISAFLLANSATITQWKQAVPVEALLTSTQNII